MRERALSTSGWVLIALAVLVAIYLPSGRTAVAKVLPEQPITYVPEPVPAPRLATSRAGALKESRTKLVAFDTAPFPYKGTIPGTDKPFLNIHDGERLAHGTPYGRVYWQDETYSDSRVLLHIPKGFDIKKPSLMIVFFHGHGATLERDVLRRQRVPAQISASGMNVVLVAPQFAVDAADSSAGKFWQPGAFARFLGEAAQKLTKLHGDKHSERVFASMPVVIVAYSGGYLPAAWCMDSGGLKKRLRGVVLLDALYGELDKFAGWITTERQAFFVSAYLDSTREKNGRLARILEDREVPFNRWLEGRLGQGDVAILSGGENVTHRDLVTHAWVDNPIEALVRRMKSVMR